jgi:hypothetical protein
MIYGTFVREPRGHVYRGLVAVLGAMAHRVLFIERIMHTPQRHHLGGFSPDGERIRLSLQLSCVMAPMLCNVSLHHAWFDLLS